MLILTAFMTVSCMFPSFGMVIFDIVHGSLSVLVLSLSHMLMLTVFMTISCMFPSLGMFIFDIVHDSLNVWCFH